MSRCFPFQPRGYEQKPRPEEGDLLKEEKRKEKKHKREKKDKEKREGKEKRDKDRSDGKHREKKDKKDKHRDKKEKHKDKKKDKDKDKEKSSISEEARLAVPSGAASSGGKLHDRDEHKDRQIGLEKAKLPNQFHVQHGEKPVKRSLSAVEAQESKFVQELGRRIRDEEKGAQSQLAERFPVEWKRDDRSDKVGGIRVLGNSADMEKNKEKGFDNHKMDAQAFRGEHRIGANAISPSLLAKSSFEGIPRPIEENVGKKREEKEKPKERRDDKPREKNKDKEREKQSHRKQKDKEKEKKKEEKAKDKSEHKKSQEDTSKDSNKNDFVVLSNNKLPLPLVSKENIAGTAIEGIVKKRKNVETNGFLHESELRPAKLLRPSSSQQPIQNGKKLDTHQKADSFSCINQGVASDIKAENKEHHKVNGNIEGPQLLSVKAKVASFMIPGADRIAEVYETPLPSVKAKASSVIPGADQISEASKMPLPSVKAKASSVIPGVDQIAEASKMPLPSVKAKATSVIPGVDQIAEASKMPLPSFNSKASSVIPGAVEIAEASKIPLPSVKAKAASVIPGVDQMIAEASKRHPHPDSKYLSHILSVPKMDDWSGLDDQEWLSRSKRPPPKSVEMCPDEVNKEHYVWSEALQIDSADVCALPYVIPY